MESNISNSNRVSTGDFVVFTKTQEVISIDTGRLFEIPEGSVAYVFDSKKQVVLIGGEFYKLSLGFYHTIPVCSEEEVIENKGDLDLRPYPISSVVGNSNFHFIDPNMNISLGRNTYYSR